MNNKRNIKGFDLTLQQDNLAVAVLSGLSIKGAAYAGAGKTTILLAIDKYYIGKRGLYLCFNKALEIEARKLFTSDNITIFTSHSLALSFLSPEDKINVLQCIGKKLPPSGWVALSKFPSSEFKDVSAISITNLLTSITDAFYQSASLDISKIHLTETSYRIIDKLIADSKIKTGDKVRFIGAIIQASKVMAAKVMDEKSDTPKTHDSYLKKWQLSKPTLDYDYIMFDESQDSSPVLLSIVLSQQCQQIFVGDEYQAIYHFRGCVNAMGTVSYENFPLNQSFRYGQKLADLASKILHHIEPSVSIIGSGFDTEIIKASEYEAAEQILMVSNTNIECYETLLQGYLAGIPMTLIGENKNKLVQNNLGALIEIKTMGSTKHPYFKKYSSLASLIDSERSNESVRLASIVNENTEHGQALIEAFDWAVDNSKEDSQFILTTAHMSKGLEADNVLIGDDFLSIIDAFSNGKEIPIVDLYLFYVAITRAKKKLVISDSVYSALQKNSKFKIIKAEVLERHTDGLAHLIGRTQTASNEAPKSSNETLSESSPGEKIPLPGNDNNDNVQIEQSKKEPGTNNNEGGANQNTGEVDIFKEIAGEEIEETEKRRFPFEHPIIKKMSTASNSEHVNHSAIAVEVGHRESDNEPQYWTPTDTNRVMNPNLAILGTMGTGKTQTVKSMLYQLHEQRKKNTGGLGFGSLIFDYKRDYCDKDFIEKTNAIILEARDLPINPFALIDKKDRIAPVRTARSVVSTLAKAFKLGTLQQQALRSCAMMAYERCGIDNREPSTYHNTAPTFKDVMDIYFSQDKVPTDSLTAAFETIQDFSLFEENKNKCKNLFDTLKGRTVVVSISGLDIHIQSLIVALFLDTFYLSMHLTPKPKPTKDGHRALTNLIMVDEADNLMSRNFDSLRKILKEGREFGVGCLLSTQGYDHFKTDENSYSDYMNAWIVHRLEAIKPAGLSGLFNLNSKKDIPDYLKVVSSLIKHHSMFVDGKNNLTYQESTAFWKVIGKS